MPTYEYRCDACGHEFEEFQSITAKSLRKCPECGKKKLKRLIGMGAGVIFKGSGFWQTDYRSQDYKKAEKADRDAAKPADKESKGSESKDSGSKDSSGGSDKSSDSTSKSSDSGKSGSDAKPKGSGPKSDSRPSKKKDR